MNIAPDEVTSILLADGWHPVIEKSFWLTADVWKRDEQRGFTFRTNGNVRMSGPMSSILAVQTKPRDTTAGHEGPADRGDEAE